MSFIFDGDEVPRQTRPQKKKLTLVKVRIVLDDLTADVARFCIARCALQDVSTVVHSQRMTSRSIHASGITHNNLITSRLLDEWFLASIVGAFPNQSLRHGIFDRVSLVESTFGIVFFNVSLIVFVEISSWSNHYSPSQVFGKCSSLLHFLQLTLPHFGLRQ